MGYIKVILIAHRGNTTGPNPQKENHPDYINLAIQQGYAVETDLWFVDNKLFLGHDAPQYQVSEQHLDSIASAGLLWAHTKNIAAFEYLTSKWQHKKQWNFFWHQEDDYTLTSLGYIWTYPSKKLTPYSICVMPEISNVPYTKDELNLCAGVCSDNIEFYRRENN